MKLNITCPERYLEAIQKARELNDTTLYECISRLAIYIAPHSWQIKKAEKELDKCRSNKVKADSLLLHFRYANSNLRKRASWNQLHYHRKYMDAFDRYFELKAGGNSEIVISEDRTPLSFYFYENNKSKKISAQWRHHLL